DRLESRAHGRHGFLGGFEGTDEKGMSSDIKSYAKQRAKTIRAQVTKEICGDAQPTPQQKKMIDDRVAQQLSAEFQANSENPEIRAILHDELSGVELSQREGQMMNAGDDSKVASALTESDWTEDEDKIIDDIKHMSPDERRRCRNDPEYINQLHKAIQSQTTWRDAMIALDSDADGSKDDDEDNFAKLERASRSSRQDTTELMFEQDDVIQALSRLNPEDYARLQADPRLQAQILTSLEGYPDKLKAARQMMAFNAADAGAATGLQIGDKPDPAKGVYSRKQVERLAFLKFGAENRIRAGSDRSWAMLVQAAEAIYNMKLRPSDGDAEAPPDAAPHVPSAVAATAGSGGGETTTTTLVASTGGAPQPDGAPQPQAAPKPAEAPPLDPKDGEAAIEDRLRHDILGDTQSVFFAATEGFGDEKGSDDKHERTSITPKRQQEIITKAILHEADPSDNLLMASTAWYGDDEDRIKDTIHKASDDQLIKEWTTVIHKSPNGSDSLGDKYTTWKTARDAAAADTKATEGKRNPKVGSPEWKARTAFKCHLLDTSEVFEDLLLKYTGGLFADDDKMKKGEDRVRDNKEWLEWRTLVRDRIPGLDKTKIGGAIQATGDTEAMEIINDPTLRNTLNALSYDEERYAVDRGENSNYNMDRVTAGGQGLALDNAMGDYRREVLTSVISKGPDAGNQYGVITAEEGGRIADAKARFNTSDSEFREAKAAVANIAATVVALVITAVVTILTAGTATGPVAVILLGAATAAASSAGTQLTKEAIQGTDFDLGKEGLENIARDTVMGAVTAGSTYYAGKIAGSLWNVSSAAEQAALVGNIAKSGAFFQQMGKSATEMALMTGM
ncbi:MAG TPA: hypothetical protein VGO00_27715, partial [Kofleriaceae bacterium]|nr:hypothetical protein [Kofleriaceae bacterium]